MVEGLEHLVLDTNILLIDANNLIQKGKVVIVPETVIDEMDSKKSLIGSELGYQARVFSRLLSKAEVLGVTTKSKGTHTLSTVAPQVTETLLKINDCYVMFVAFSHYTTQEGFSYSNDRKILEVAKYYSVTKQAKFISNDNAARLRAISLGIVAEEFSIVEDIDVQFTREVVIENDLMFEMLNNKPVSQVIPDHKTGTYNYVVSNPNTSQVKLCFVDNNGMLIHLDSTIEKDIRKNVNIAPINTQQLFLARAIQDTSIPLVICEALAGSGKTLLTLSNGLRMVELGKYAGIVYIRHSVDDVPKEEEVGFLSGNDEKMAVYFHPLYDSIEVMVRGKHKNSKIKGKDFEDMIAAEVEKMITEHHIVPMTGLGLRGRTLTNQFVIIDEAQNPNSSSMQKTLTRIGKGCKVVVIGSNKQIDNPYSTKYTNGLSYLLNACKQENSIPVYGVDLHKVVRSDIAEFAEKLYSKEVK